MAKSKNSKVKSKAKVKSKTAGKVMKKKPASKAAKKTLKPKVAAKVAAKVVGKAKGKVAAKVVGKAKGKVAAAKVKAKIKAKVKTKANIKVKSKVKPMAAPKKAPVTKATSPVPKIALKSPQTAAKLSKLLTPLDDRLIVQVHPQELKTAGGLYIPDTAAAGNSGNLKGTVISAGRGHQNKKGRVRPMDVKPGDQIVFSEFAGSKIVVDGKDLIVIRETEVLGIIA